MDTDVVNNSHSAANGAFRPDLPVRSPQTGSWALSDAMIRGWTQIQRRTTALSSSEFLNHS